MILKERFKDILGINTPIDKIIVSSGLKTHMIKRKHFEALKYLDRLEDILNNPDYIGVNPNEKNTSIEFIKVYDNNVLLALKLDSSNEHFYIASVYIKSQAKIEKMLVSGRIKKL